ncbi:hypothetical protein POPTR_012G059801v4 [Populus trichocarpa]|uniref:Uncharacterized protein n=1 Tax=Populus trichocarpa TaxID=3694 RepID=A0ACC0S4U9_POPTR|nr:hypothetical protein BDE02_12G044900 [Populus trichocarpa]KAI9384413.1 hypothetical protein POPTR_012G059801v4 [Populus trichocarpa]
MVQPLKEKKRYLSRHGSEIPTMIPVIHGATQPLPPLRNAFFFSLLGFSFFFFSFFPGSEVAECDSPPNTHSLPLGLLFLFKNSSNLNMFDHICSLSTENPNLLSV